MRDRERAIAELAARQHAMMARAQLVGLGLGRGAIAHRLELGRLNQVYRGVYTVGHRRLTRRGRLMAAVLACGPGAVLSHRSAAELWGLRRTVHGRIEVTVLGRVRPRAGIEVRRARLPPDEHTMLDGIPVTTVPRTLLDLAAIQRPHELRRAMEQAEILRLTDALSLPALLERYPGRRGSGKLKAIIAADDLGATATRSDLEDDFLAFIESAGLPRPLVNASLEVAGQTIEPDFLWRAQRVIVELDGGATHHTRAAFERDRARDRRLQAAGWRTVRVTWRHLHLERAALERDLRALLAPGGAGRARA